MTVLDRSLSREQEARAVIQISDLCPYPLSPKMLGPSSGAASPPRGNHGDDTTTPSSALMANDDRIYGDDCIPLSTGFATSAGSTLSEEGAWECNVCTVLNENPLHLVCDVCGTPKNCDSGTPKLENQASLNDIEKQSMKPEIIEGDEGPIPASHVSNSSTEMDASTSIFKTNFQR